MKRLIWLVVLALLATLTIPSEALSRAQAFSYTDPAGGGEDLHPWGGEDDFGNTDGIQTTEFTQYQVYTGIWVIDQFINLYLLDRKDTYRPFRGLRNYDDTQVQTETYNSLIENNQTTSTNRGN